MQSYQFKCQWIIKSNTSHPDNKIKQPAVWYREIPNGSCYTASINLLVMTASTSQDEQCFPVVVGFGMNCATRVCTNFQMLVLESTMELSKCPCALEQTVGKLYFMKNDIVNLSSQPPTSK